jgi:hypothetical protein
VLHMRRNITYIAGIEYRHSKVLLDEIPAACRDIDEVMEHARDLVRVKYVLKQFVNVKVVDVCDAMLCSRRCVSFRSEANRRAEAAA